MKISRKIRGAVVIESMITYTILFALAFFVVFSVSNFVIGSQLEDNLFTANRSAITQESWSDAFFEIQSELQSIYGEEVLFYAEIRDARSPDVILASSGNPDPTSGITPPDPNDSSMEAAWAIGNKLIIHGYRSGSARTIINSATTVVVPWRDEPITLIRRHVTASTSLVIENETRTP